jgi:hypothetical protein
MAAPVLQQVPRHWRTHVAEPDKAYIHGLILLVTSQHLVAIMIARRSIAALIAINLITPLCRAAEMWKT